MSPKFQTNNLLTSKPQIQTTKYHGKKLNPIDVHPKPFILFPPYLDYRHSSQLILGRDLCKCTGKVVCRVTGNLVLTSTWWESCSGRRPPWLSPEPTSGLPGGAACCRWTGLSGSRGRSSGSLGGEIQGIIIQ